MIMRDNSMQLGSVTQENIRAPALRFPKTINVVQVQTTATTIYTASNEADFHIESLIASNVTASAAYVTMHLVPDGGSVGADNMVLYQHAVAAKNRVLIYNKNSMGLLQPGMTIQALCGTNDDINMFGHGFDYRGVFG